MILQSFILFGCLATWRGLEKQGPFGVKSFVALVELYGCLAALFEGKRSSKVSDISKAWRLLSFALQRLWFFEMPGLTVHFVLPTLGTHRKP